MVSGDEVPVSPASGTSVRLINEAGGQDHTHRQLNSPGLEFEVDRHHKVTHRSHTQIEQGILAGCTGSSKLLPGESRLMTPCIVCALNRPKKPVRHHNPEWHYNELKYKPGEALQLDVLHSTVLSRFGKFRYHPVCV